MMDDMLFLVFAEYVIEHVDERYGRAAASLMLASPIALLAATL
jgi:hypothetical protein